ncbi:hypothetical protein E2320_014439, partial [Naja naja]
KISGCSFKSCSKRIKTFGERKTVQQQQQAPVEEPKGPDLVPASSPTCLPLTSQEPLRPSKQHKRLRRRHHTPVAEPKEEFPVILLSSNLILYRFNAFQLGLSPFGVMSILAMPCRTVILCFLRR